MITVCFTGHRPDKLGGYDWHTEKNKRIITKLKDEIVKLINDTDDNHFRFICGGALGIDQMAFAVCKYIKLHTLKLNPVEIKIVLAMPFEKQACKWFNKDDVNRFNQQRRDTDEVVLVDTLEEYQCKIAPVGDYHVSKMELRNRYMVDQSDKIIAVWNGTKGGTYNCVRYAKQKGREIIRLNPDEI